MYETGHVGDTVVYTCLTGYSFRSGHAQKTARCIKKLDEELGEVVVEWENVKGRCLRK